MTRPAAPFLFTSPAAAPYAMRTPTSSPEDYQIQPGQTFAHLTTPGPDNGQLAEFIASYLAAAFTLAEDELGPDASQDDLAAPDRAHVATDCAQFLATATARQLLGPDSNFSQAGADYWLTRNGHGAGFWDRPELYGDTQAEQLSKLAQDAGPADLELGDDGQVYLFPPVAYLAGQ